MRSTFSAALVYVPTKSLVWLPKTHRRIIKLRRLKNAHQRYFQLAKSARNAHKPAYKRTVSAKLDKELSGNAIELYVCAHADNSLEKERELFEPERRSLSRVGTPDSK